MTSAEFVAKYKLFKPIAERGARSFLAQEVQGHRAVLVHRLDIAPPDENRRLLSSLESIRPDERGSVIEVTEVDGIAIVVTRFTPDFHDLPSWLAQREQPGAMARPAQPPTTPPASSGFTSALFDSGIATAPSVERTTPAPGSAPDAVRPPGPTTPRAGSGDFTQLFGAPPGRAPEPPAPPIPPPMQPPPPAATPAPGEFTQLFKGIAAAPGAPATPEPRRDFRARTQPIAPPPPPRSDSSLPPAQSISAPPPPPWAAAAPAPPQPMAPSVHPYTSQPPPFSSAPPSASPPPPPPPPPAPPPSTPGRGEFTQLFQGFSSPSAPAPGAPQFPGPPAPPSFASPSAPSTSSPGGFPPLPPSGLGDGPSIMGRPGPPTFADPSRSPIPPAGPPPPPPLGGSFGAPPPFSASFGGASASPPLSQGGGPPMPPPLSSGGIFGAPPTSPPAPAAFPPSTLPGMAPTVGSSAGASEFTRMLGAIAPPKGPAGPPPMPIAPSSTAPPATGGQQSGGGSIKAYLPLILGLNVVLIALAAVILYFLLKR